VVEVYVGYLRRKIDTPFGRQTVQTVRGAGYRLTADGGGTTSATASATPVSSD
jgi:DNA-binding winged helix-turn-helix (wHTH) protein